MHLVVITKESDHAEYCFRRNERSDFRMAFDAMEGVSKYGGGNDATMGINRKSRAMDEENGQFMEQARANREAQEQEKSAKEQQIAQLQSKSAQLMAGGAVGE